MIESLFFKKKSNNVHQRIECKECKEFFCNLMKHTTEFSFLNNRCLMVFWYLKSMVSLPKELMFVIKSECNTQKLENSIIELLEIQFRTAITTNSVKKKNKKY